MTEKSGLVTPIRVMISDDHPLVRQGLKLALGVFPDLEVVAEAENGEQAVRLAAEILPDILVMEIQMPKKDGITAIQESPRPIRMHASWCSPAFPTTTSSSVRSRLGR
jgi:DNA-binding NarL/FixJ family response regulator